MHVAQMETQSFSFTALGDTEFMARAALIDGWEFHTAQLRRENPGSRWFSGQRALEEYSAVVFEIKPGECARDYVRVTSRA